ncbi:MAG: histidine phosphatase family protein [Pseudomonadota bacterium]
MFKVYLIRHGECKGNKEGLFRGRSDFPLNENGIRQSLDLAKALSEKDIMHVYSSPLKRAHQTAESISLELHLPLTSIKDFNNIHLGEWEGMHKDVIMKEYPKEWEIWKANPEKLQMKNCETLESVAKRSSMTIENLRLKHENDTIAIVTHRAVIKPLIASLLEIKEPYFWKLHMDNCSYSILEYHSSNYMLSKLNVTDHLNEYVNEMY